MLLSQSYWHVLYDYQVDPGTGQDGIFTFFWVCCQLLLFCPIFVHAHARFSLLASLLRLTSRQLSVSSVVLAGSGRGDACTHTRITIHGWIQQICRCSSSSGWR
ncbi:hypothetical protein BDW71DRAFT_89892 [Aspergillus fruticulosus]